LHLSLEAAHNGPRIWLPAANFLVLPKLAESLAGRIEIHTLWPFSASEVSPKAGSGGTRFVDAVFSPRSQPVSYPSEL